MFYLGNSGGGWRCGCGLICFPFRILARSYRCSCFPSRYSRPPCAGVWTVFFCSLWLYCTIWLTIYQVVDCTRLIIYFCLFYIWLNIYKCDTISVSRGWFVGTDWGTEKSVSQISARKHSKSGVSCKKRTGGEVQSILRKYGKNFKRSLAGLCSGLHRRKRGRGVIPQPFYMPISNTCLISLC